MMKNSKNLIYFSLLFIIVLLLVIMLPSIVNAGTYVPYGGTSAYYDGYNYNYNNSNNYYNHAFTYNGSTSTQGTNNTVLAPSIDSISPNTINKTSTPVIISIWGKNFTSSTIARLNGIDQTTTFVNTNHIEMHIFNSKLLFSGDFKVTVYNPNSLMYSNTVILKITNGSQTSTTTNTSTTSTTEQNTETNKNSNENDTLSAGAIIGYSGFFPSSIIQWILFIIFVLLIIFLWREFYITEKDRAKPLKHH